MAKVKFFAVDLKSTFNEIAVKDEYALYWIMETQEIYKGDILFGSGSNATALSSGLMSAEDKQKLDAISQIEGGLQFLGVSTTDPKEGIVTIDGEIVEASAGDIVIYGTKEYICDKNGNFIELGDEGLYLTIAQAEKEYLKKEEAKSIYETKEEAELSRKQLEDALKLIDIKDIEWAKDDADETKYEVISAVEGYLTNDSQNDLRVFIPKGSKYNLQDVGDTGDASTYYMTVRAWAPRADITGCRKGNYSKYEQDFKEMESIKIDAESGRPYVDFWLAIAYTTDKGETWIEYADLSAGTKYIGFDWLVEWYVGDELVSSGFKKITLVNDKDMFYNGKDWYVPVLEEKLKLAEEQIDIMGAKLDEYKKHITWGQIG